MGTFVTNLHVRDADRDAVIEARRSLDAVPAFVRGSPEDTWTSIFPEAADQDLSEMASNLSKALNRPVIAFFVHDSDVFLYWLYNGGKELDRYNSAPGYFRGEETSPEGGNPDTLGGCCAPGLSTDLLLRLLSSGAEERVFAEDRLAELAKLLGIPDGPAVDSYRYLLKGEGSPGSLTLVDSEGEQSIRLE